MMKHNIALWKPKISVYNGGHNILTHVLIFYQIFLSLQVKRSVIISNKMVYTSCLTSCRMT